MLICLLLFDRLTNNNNNYSNKLEKKFILKKAGWAKPNTHTNDTPKKQQQLHTKSIVIYLDLYF